MTKPLPESAVLTPRDPDLTNSDEWPEYRLNDATVTLPDGEAGSLLRASEHYPVTITGKLEAVSKELAHTFLLNSKQRTPAIEVNEVRSFAYGAYGDGSVEIWAAGKAGWFVISPARAYKTMYNEMTEAVNVLFFVADAYRTPRKSGKGKNATLLPDYSPQDLFEKYAVEIMGRQKGASDAAQRMYRHRDFLLSSMIAGKEGLSWGRNPLYGHLCRKFPAEVKAIRQRISGPAQRAEVPPKLEAPPTTTATRARLGSVDTASTTSSLKRKRGRPPKERPADVISIGSSSTADSVAKEPPPEPMIPVEQISPKPNAAPTRRGRSNTKTSAPDPTPESETPEVQESQVATPIHNDSDSDSPNPKHKRKSALRLKPSKPSKGPPKSQKSGKAPLIDEDDDEDELQQPTPQPNTKRKRDTQPPQRKSSKRRPSKPDLDEGIDIPTSPSASDAEISNTPDATVGASDHTSADLSIRLLHSPDPIQEDVWLCALDGCTHKVYSASLPQSQKLIREHYALHAYDDDERVQLVKRLQAPSVPVERLMDKVRMQARVEGFPGSRVAGSRFPEPLQARY